MLDNNDILSKITPKTAKDIAKTYNILSPYIKLKSSLQTIFPEKNINEYSKLDIHLLFNKIILEKYKSEILYKSLLVDYFINENVTAAFEIKANSSRLDFLRINGSTISYEIKSEVDNLSKLEKQVSDYSKLFDYNYVVIGQNHLTSIKSILPKNYGIFVVKNDKLQQYKKSKKNTKTDVNLQLNLFTKKELLTFFNNNDKSNIPNLFSLNQIQNKFHSMLKNRYIKKWEFLKENKNNILPIDYQYFFRHNISPDIIYERGN